VMAAYPLTRYPSLILPMMTKVVERRPTHTPTPTGMYGMHLPSEVEGVLCCCSS
jgi:hypothetical protein